MFDNQTPFGMSISGQDFSNFVKSQSMSQVRAVDSLIALGNPIVDITVNVDKETIQNCGLEWGRTVFNNDITQKFLDSLDSRPIVTYTPGGSIMNTLRVCSWCLNMNPSDQGKFKITMLGAVGNDVYKDKIINSLRDAKVEPLLEIKQEKTSRCGVGIYKKDRCLVPDIQASKNLSKEFINEKQNIIFEHEVLLIEGYFLRENFELCKYLCEEFNN